MIHEENGQIIVDDVTSELIDAAEKYAEIYSDDERQDIKTDVLNAFYHGANYQKKCQQDQIIVDELRPMSEAPLKVAVLVKLVNGTEFHRIIFYTHHEFDKCAGWLPMPIYRPKVK